MDEKDEPKDEKEYVVVMKRMVFSPMIVSMEKDLDGKVIHRVQAFIEEWYDTAEEAFEEGEKYLQK